MRPVSSYFERFYTSYYTNVPHQILVGSGSTNTSAVYTTLVWTEFVKEFGDEEHYIEC
jgi:hypothetical protein